MRQKMSDPGPQSDDDWRPANIRTDISHPARIYDYWLGGKDNFEADRSAAEFALGLLPEYRDYARGNRKFLVRATRFLCDAGIRQFLDIGAGLPTSPNVHEMAQATDPDARVVYVDNDPMVYVHAEALMAKGATTSVVRADMRDVDTVVQQAGELLDFSKPVALMFVASLHHVLDSDDPAGIVARYLEAVAPGSYLVLSHMDYDYHPEKMRLGSEEARRRGGTIYEPRRREDILRMFNGRELLDPGLVLVSYWRPDGAPDHNADRVMALGGVAQL
jgi:hypothetical protein